MDSSIEFEVDEGGLVDGIPDLFAVMAQGEHGEYGIVAANGQPMVVASLDHIPNVQETLRRVADHSGITLVVLKYSNPSVVQTVRPTQHSN